jgi:hypothetical protein
MILVDDAVMVLNQDRGLNTERSTADKSVNKGSLPSLLACVHEVLRSHMDVLPEVLHVDILIVPPPSPS